MRYIFYDFETSDLSRLGQILNFSFIVTDEQFQVLDEFSDIIRIERTVLPRAKAILANRIDVQEHQKAARLSEYEAAQAFARFIDAQIEEAGEWQVMLAGFNTARFDLKFLHTTLIRNGVNPYGRFRMGDLFFVAQKLYLSSESFRQQLDLKGIKKTNPEGQERPSLSLESLSKAFGGLEGPQTHQSRDDVLLTIELAKVFAELGMPLAKFVPYEPPLQVAPRLLSEGFIVNRVLPWPNYEHRAVPHLLLSDFKKNAIWADLASARDLLEKGEGRLRDALRYIKKDEIFLLGPEEDYGPYKDISQRLKDEFLNISLDEYFPRTTCDIEDFIYRIRYDQISELHKVLTRERPATELPPDWGELYLRFRLRNYEWGGEYDEKAREQLTAFAANRFGGKAELLSGEKYPSFDELLQEVRDAARDCQSPEDASLMESLQQFYLSSDVARSLASPNSSV